ncbi:hypothetical protein MMC25_001717 [Agyrium rufum]|nr:hypothetical protein [Agyrium rufum]
MTTISESGDLSIKVIQYMQPSPLHAAQRVAATETFIADFASVIKASEVLTSLLQRWQLKVKQGIIEPGPFIVKSQSVASMSILLHVMHDLSPKSIYEVSIEEMWHLREAQDFFQIDISKLYPWFKTWMYRHNFEHYDPSLLLFPSYTFGHAQAFAYATRMLAYESSRHIEETNPTHLRSRRLPAQILSMINAAKGRLHSKFSDTIQALNKIVLDSTECTCTAATYFGFNKALHNTKAWLLARTYDEDSERNKSTSTARKSPYAGNRASMAEIVDRLETFQYRASSGACRRCRRNYKRTIATLRERLDHLLRRAMP